MFISFVAFAGVIDYSLIGLLQVVLFVVRYLILNCFEF